ncbi:MAG: DUF5670 family protein [Terriglobales bacterium]
MVRSYTRGGFIHILLVLAIIRDLNPNYSRAPARHLVGC